MDITVLPRQQDPIVSQVLTNFHDIIQDVRAKLQHSNLQYKQATDANRKKLSIQGGIIGYDKATKIAMQQKENHKLKQGVKKSTSILPSCHQSYTSQIPSTCST